MQIIEQAKSYDAVVVGSGATGGWMAKKLAEGGMEVALLEAGPKITPEDFTEHVQRHEMRYRGFSPDVARNRPIQSMKGACSETNYEWFVNDIENPYTYPDGMKYQWTRSRILGGRSVTWGRQSYRLSPMDFKPASKDGYGEDWPISYEDVEPYYQQVERYVGISGSEEGLPQVPDSIMLPPMGMNCGEKHFKKSVESKLGRPVIIARSAVLTREHNGRAACHYCGPCARGCVTNSYFSSPPTTIADAVATGRCTVITDAVVSHVENDPNTGLARSVHYVDRVTRQPREVRAKVVALCASTLESTRILLNSGEGYCNSSGALGRYLMDHVTGGMRGILPVREGKAWSGPPIRPTSLYIPRTLNLDRSHTDGMIRGYGYQVRHASMYDNVGWIAGRPGFGRTFKQSALDAGSAYRMNVDSYNETLPRWENRAEISPTVKDAWGIPALHITASWGDNDMKLWRHSREVGMEMLRAAGAENITGPNDPTLPGGKTHEVGTARMGNDPRKSVLNKWNHAHDVNNLYVTDGAAFVSVACQNPTLTMMALTVRAADHILERGRRGELG